MKKRMITLGLILLCIVTAQGALASDIQGEWQGKVTVSALPISLRASITFGDDGRFSGSTWGLSVTGSYETDGDSLAITIETLDGFLASQLQAPEKIGRVQVPMLLDGDTLSFSAEALGMEGEASFQRK